MRRFKGPLETAACLAVLAAAAIVFLYPAVFDGKIPWAAEPLYTLAPWEQAQWPSMDTEAARDDSLFALRYFSAYRFINESAQDGESILWNPYENAGMPFLAQWRTRAMSPFTLPVYVMPLPQALRLAAVLKVLMAGFAAYWLARRMGLVRATALIPAAAFELSAAALLWLEAPVSDAMPGLPLLLIAFTPLGARWPRVVCAPLAVALMFFAGSPEAAIVAVLFCAFYLLFSRDLALSVQGLVRLSVAVVIGALLAAIQVLPAVELMRLVSSSPTEAAVLFLPLTMLALLYPGAGPPPPEDVLHAAPWTLLVFVGGANLAFLTLWIGTRTVIPKLRRKTGEAPLWAGLIVALAACVFIAFKPGAHWFNGFGLHHALFHMPLALGLTVGWTLQQWVVLDPDQCRKALKRIWPVALPVFVVIAGLFIASFWVAMEGVDREAPMHTLLLWLAAWALIGWTLLKPSARVAGYAGALLVMASSYFAFAPHLHFSFPQAFFPVTDFVESLQTRGGRVSGSTQLQRWPLAGNGVPQFFGTSGFRLKRQQGFLEQVENDPLLHRRTGSPNLLLTKQDIQGSFASVRPMLRVDKVFASGAVLFEDLGTDSRTRMAYDARPVPALRIEAIQSTRPPIVERNKGLEDVDGPAARPAIEDPETHTTIAIRVGDTRPGLLVVADAYYPGWTAQVNGEEREIVAVDGMFRGVPLDAGSHEVVLTYRPDSFRIGMVLSLVTLFLYVAGVIWTLRRPSKQHED